MKCSACGEENVQNAKFCCFCGAKLSAACQTPASEESPSEETAAREPVHTVKPLSDNPYQPRRMPTFSTAPAASSKSEHERPGDGAPLPKSQKVFLFDDEESEEAERLAREEEARRAEQMRREVMRKRAEDPFYGEEDDEEDDDYDDDDDESSGRGGKIFVAVISVLTVLILAVGLFAFLFYTSIGSRLRAYYGFASDAQDYVYLAEWQKANGNNADAAASYYKAFMLNQDDYAFALETAQNFEGCGAYERAEQMYLYLIDKYPLENDPYDFLMALLVREGKDDAYNALIAYRAEHQSGYVAPAADSAPVVPAAPTADKPGGSYTGTVKISLSAEEGAAIHFTFDGSEPTAASSLYTGPITLYSGTYTLRAVAILNGVSSVVWEATYAVS